MITSPIDSLLHILEPYNARLCLATKTQNIETIKKANINTVLIIAENKVQELEEKWEYYKSIPNEIHFIGRLQDNKIRKAVKMCTVIQSVDSLALLKKINRIATEEGKIQRVFLNINISNDPNKSGFLIPSPEYQNIETLLSHTTELLNIRIEGLFTILAAKLSETEILNFYQKMKTLQQVAQKIMPSITELSMGMSHDYLLALKADATIVRIGSGIFGERTPKPTTEI
ncbi:MAG: YggS family pyridoxal phosphate-dependent enzyme [Candidatus Peregrinibacteria bacterium]